MAFEKIQAFTKLIANLPDAPNDTMTSTELKQYWDSSPEELRQAFNKLIDDLESIGADIQGLNARTIKEVLENLKTYIDEHKNDIDNPHNVTASQLGVYTKAELAPFLQGGETYIQYEVFRIANADNGDGTFTYTDDTNTQHIGNLTPEGYQVFTLRKGEYVPNSNRVEAVVNDVLQRSNASGGLMEINSVTVALTTPESAGAEITIKYFGRIGLSGEHSVMVGEDQPPISESSTLWLKVLENLSNKVEIRPVGDGNYDKVLFPKTSADMVIDEVNGGTVADFITEVRNKPEVVPKPSAEVYFVGMGVKTADTATNTFVLTLPEGVTLDNGLALSFQIPTTVTNAFLPVAVSINGTSYNVHKGNASASRLSVIGAPSILTIRYMSSHSVFFVQGEGGDYGTATAGQVLAGATFGTDNGLVTGTMPNRMGTTTAGTRRSTASGYIDIAPQAGYYTGNDGTFTRISDSNFTAANIKSGVSMFGLTGSLVGGSYYSSAQNYNMVYDANYGLICSGGFSGIPFTPVSWLYVLTGVSDNLGQIFNIAMFGRSNGTLYNTYVSSSAGGAHVSVSGGVTVGSNSTTHNLYINGTGGFRTNQTRSLQCFAWSV